MENILQRMDKYSRFSSWAIWESLDEDKVFNETSKMNTCINFSKYADKLRKTNVVFLAMNPGGKYYEKEAKKATREANSSNEKWLNFHTNGISRDYLLANAIMGTEVEGSYITDFFPIIGNSKIVKKFIEKEENNQLRNELINELDEEIRDLFNGEKISYVNLICIGDTSFKWAEKYLMNSKNNSFKVCKIPHYSKANTHLATNAKKEKLTVLEYYSNQLKEVLKEINIITI